MSADAINYRKACCSLALFALTELLVEILYLEGAVPRAIFTQLPDTGIFPASAVIPADLPDFLDKIFLLNAVVMMVRLVFFRTCSVGLASIGWSGGYEVTRRSGVL